MSGAQQAAIWGIDGAWAVWLLIWIALSRRVKAVARRESLALRAAHIGPMLLAAWLLTDTPSTGAWLNTALLPRAPWMVFVGLALVVAGLAFAVWARLVLAGNWSGTVTLKHGHELVRTGPYALARHPIYTGLLTAMLGNAVTIDAVRGVLAFLIITVAFLKKMRTEEAFMAQAFGAEYAAYRAEVPALVPKIGGHVPSPPNPPSRF
jgi:protein-S-isoprenylcysteine O-methyltransferase Ste14